MQIGQYMLVAPPNSPTFEEPMDDIRSWPSTDLDKDICLPDSPPKGTVTPNGLPWGHSPNDFFKVILPSSDPVSSKDKPKDVIWSKCMIEEAWGKDVFAIGRLAEETAADEDVRELSPRLRRPWPMLGISASLPNSKLPIPPGEAEERMKTDFGVIDEGSDHEGEFEMRDDGQHGEFQMDSEEMLKEIQDFVACWACMYSPPCSSRSGKFVSHHLLSFFFP